MLENNYIHHLIARGEDSFTQFKLSIDTSKLSEEMVAFANSQGGVILVGIDDDGKIKGVENDNHVLNAISNASADGCIPPIFPTTKNFIIEGKKVVTIEVSEGFQKPYRTKTGKYLIKSGADKRILSSEELLRMATNRPSILYEELPIQGTNAEHDLSKDRLYLYFEKVYKESLVEFLEKNSLNLPTLLQNLGLIESGSLNLVGLLFFAKNTQRYRPSYLIKSVHINGLEIYENNYVSSEDSSGTIDQQFKEAYLFIKSNLLKKQVTETFNSIGQIEISEIAIEETLVNALVHRDYSIMDTIKVLIFSNRVEIINPGYLINHLTIEKIKFGTAIARNPILLSYASKLLPYRGLGSGILRILKEHPNTEFFNDRESGQFKVVMYR
jgi:ATP-dependent DNA helicase RecG